MNKSLLLCLASLLLLAGFSLTALAEAAPEKMTMAQLEQLRDEGKVEYVLRDEGYVTWLRGEFYNRTVEGEAGVEATVEHLRDVLGLDEDAQFIKGVEIEMSNGYTYYTIRQFSGTHPCSGRRGYALGRDLHQGWLANDGGCGREWHGRGGHQRGRSGDD